MQDFWAKVEQALQKVDPSVVLTQEARIFGITGCWRRNTSTITNLILQSAQRCIWYSRVDYEEKDVVTDMWESLCKRLLTLSRLARELLAPRIFKEFFSDLIDFSGSQLILKV